MVTSITPQVSPFVLVPVSLSALPDETRRRVRQPGWRLGHLTARATEAGRLAIEVLLLNAVNGGGAILTADLPEGTREFPSVTPDVPAAHWAERAVGDMFGLRAVGHPRWKSLLLHHDAWPAAMSPLGVRPEAEKPRDEYAFMRVKGEGIHEIPVGPVHAGIIEPGHFRFSCMGEIITNLEIRLGYLHRGVEKRLCETSWQRARFVAESASTDTTVGNALAHAVAVEQLLGLVAPPRAAALRTIALEIERLASHLGDLGGLSADIGYSAGASLFAPLRAAALGLGQTLTGNRLQRWYVLPGGVARDLDDARGRELALGLSELAARTRKSIPLLLENPGALDRMEGTGRLAPHLARDFGIVGPVARASGSRYDARCVFPHAAYPAAAPAPARAEAGDVLARALVRAHEIETSIAVISEMLETLPASSIRVDTGRTLPASRVGVGVVEAWRGELIHWVTTDETGAISRYAIKDPSFNNWTGLAIAIRGNLVADFPLCNKSFSLSYSGNDL